MKAHRVIAIFIVLVLQYGSSSYGQNITSAAHFGVEQVPYGDPVYPFLKHLFVRGIIEGYSEAQLPLSEFEISELLKRSDTGKLSGAERDLRAKYLQTYAHEPREVVTMFPAKDAIPLFFEGILTQQDKYLYRWFDDSTKSDLFVHGIASLEERHESSPRSASVRLASLGGRFSGTLGGHVGYFMQTTNGAASGDSLLPLEDPMLRSNVNFGVFTHTFYDFTSAELAYNYDWFTAKLAREQIAIGGGYQGDNILLSPNSAPYDFVSLGAHVGAVRYQSILSALVSDTAINGQFPSKFLALHDLTFLLGKNFELGFTDMLVFGERFEFAYANPFSFLSVVEKDVDHSDKDNAILGTHLRWRITPGVEVGGQALVDDVVAEKIGKGAWDNKFAWQFGGMWSDPFGIPNLDWTVEWIRVEPFVYSHWNDDDDRYTTSGTLLGAQIGPNAISYQTGVRWSPSAQWTLSLGAQYLQRGENVYDSSGNLVYNAGSDFTLSMNDKGQRDNTHILNGRQVHIFNLTLSAEFEPWRGLVVFASGTKRSVDYLSVVTPGVDLAGLPVSLAPRVLPETLISIGARALF